MVGWYCVVGINSFTQFASDYIFVIKDNIFTFMYSINVCNNVCCGIFMKQDYANDCLFIMALFHASIIAFNINFFFIMHIKGNSFFPSL